MLNARKVEAAKGKEELQAVWWRWPIPSGRNLMAPRYWRMKYRFAGKRETIVLWCLSNSQHFADARQKREDAKKLLSQKILAKSKAKAKQGFKCMSGDDFNPFREVALEWVQNEITLNGLRAMFPTSLEAFEKDIFPHIGHRPIGWYSALELL